MIIQAAWEKVTRLTQKNGRPSLFRSGQHCHFDTNVRKKLKILLWRKHPSPKSLAGGPCPCVNARKEIKKKKNKTPSWFGFQAQETRIALLPKRITLMFLNFKRAANECHIPGKRLPLVDQSGWTFWVSLWSQSPLVLWCHQIYTSHQTPEQWHALIQMIL